jgi:hypothetical protein
MKWLTTRMATVNNGVYCADHPYLNQTRKARRVDDHTAVGFCKFCDDLISKELEECRKCRGLAFSASGCLELF